MRPSILTTVVVALVVCAPAIAQEKPSTVQPETRAAFSPKPLTVSGKVSADGKTLLTDIDSEWLVSNADALRGHEGQLVRLKCYVNTEKNSLQVLSVKREESESKYSARNTDSAFRR